MNEARLKLLLEYLNEEPNDPFNIYAVATEYVGTFPEKALPYFEKLLTAFPDYLATYYHAAALYFALGQNEQASQTYQKGIALAQQQQNQNALRELKNAYQNFQFEADEDE